MTSEMDKSASADMGYFLHYLNPDIRKITKRLEHIHLKILKKKYYLVFNQTCLGIYIYIYI